MQKTIRKNEAPKKVEEIAEDTKEKPKRTTKSKKITEED